MPTPTQRIVLQVSEADYDAIKAAADKRRMPVSQLLRLALLAQGVKVQVALSRKP